MTRLRRRELLLGAGASAAGLMALAGCDAVPGRTPKKPALIGFLTAVTDSTGPGGPADGFLQGLREHGLIEGDNLRIEWRFAEGNNDRLPGLAAELVSLGVQVIATTGGAPSTVAGETTDRVPIVVMGGAALVDRGLALSASRPGRNMTGVQFPNELQAKALEALREILPGARRLALMANVQRLDVNNTKQFADQFQLELLTLDIQSQADLEPAFGRAVAWGAEMLSAHNVVPLNTPRAVLPSLALHYRLPAASQNTAWTEAGLLLAYSASLWHAGHRAATHVARILNGANPGELPIELATVFDLVINRRTLAHLGLDVPSHVAARVTQWVD